jgi:hypothetical protein|tara:strand:- start:40457 stop:40663 length:207 start_codon:yes stop_codon:yes gene_type:complete
MTSLSKIRHRQKFEEAPKNDFTGNMIRVNILKEEIAHLKTLLQPTDTGHIHTAISVLEDRIKELENEK